MKWNDFVKNADTFFFGLSCCFRTKMLSHDSTLIFNTNSPFHHQIKEFVTFDSIAGLITFLTKLPKYHFSFFFKFIHHFGYTLMEFSIIFIWNDKSKYEIHKHKLSLDEKNDSIREMSIWNDIKEPKYTTVDIRGQFILTLSHLWYFTCWVFDRNSNPYRYENKVWPFTRYRNKF